MQIENKSLTIGEVARQAGVNLETMRYYERRGLIAKPPRTPSGYRKFPETTLHRVQFIKHAQALGFTLQGNRRASCPQGGPGHLVRRREATGRGEGRGHRAED